MTVQSTCAVGSDVDDFAAFDLESSGDVDVGIGFRIGLPDGELVVDLAVFILVKALPEDFGKALEIESPCTTLVVPLKKRTDRFIFRSWHGFCPCGGETSARSPTHPSLYYRSSEHPWLN